jgi:SAM-dependent methyltransferase
MFANLYDMLMSDVDYEQLYQVIKPYIKPYDFILDAGCGSGYLLVELLKHEHHAVGIDLSSEMLARAQEKIQSEGLSAMLYEHDLRKPMAAEFDVILAMFDVINYFKGAKKVFKNFYQALDTKGILIFDLYHVEVMQTFHNYLESETEPLNYQWHIQIQNSKIEHTIHYEDNIEQVTQYMYPLTYYLDLLHEIGFETKIIQGPDSRKHYIVAKK